MDMNSYLADLSEFQGVVILSKSPPYNSQLMERPGGLGQINMSAIKSFAMFGEKPVWVSMVDDSYPLDENGAIDFPKEGSEKAHFKMIGVVPGDLAKGYCNYCDAFLYPLFLSSLPDISFAHSHWKHYGAVNENFADAALGVSGPDSLIDIHDYQLLLVPGIIRENWEGFSGVVSYMHHITWPEPDKFMKVPNRKELMRSLLGADLVGMQIPAYLDNFIRCLYDMRGELGRIGINEPDGVIEYGGNITNVATFPVSIDFGRRRRLAESTSRSDWIEFLRRFGFSEEDEIILKVDRCDPVKGIAEGLEGFERLLDDNPCYRGRVKLFQTLPSSRNDINLYRNYMHEISRKRDRINSKYRGSVYIHPEAFSSDELAPVFRFSPCILISSMADGMNAVGMEYVASKLDGESGVVLLSKKAGASERMGNGPIIIDPEDPVNVSLALRKESMPQQK